MAEDIGFGRLPHGAKILWEYVRSSPTFSLGFFFATGSRYDPPGQSGMAHLVEHLVFKGTRSHSASSLARLVDRVGGDLNAWTDREEVAFTCTVPAESWAVALEALAELTLYPQFPPEEFDREKEVIRNEILASLEDPEELSYEAYLQGVAPGPWSQSVAGTEATLGTIRLEDVRGWWARHGAPAHLTVAFSGGVAPEGIRDAVARYLEEIPGVPPGPLGPAPVFQPGRKVWSERSDFQMTQVIGGFHVPKPLDPREAATWQMTSMLWGETMSSRLFQSVREQRGLCYSITSQMFDTETLWGLQFFASCAPENGVAMVACLRDEVRRLTDEPPHQDEWDDALAALRGGVILGSEKTENRVGRLWQQFGMFHNPLGTAGILATLEERVSVTEQRRILDHLSGQRPSLLVWGKLPRRLDLRSWDA